MGLIQQYLLKTLPAAISTPAKWNESPLADLDQISLGAYMREHGASEGAVELVAETQYFGARMNRTSMLSAALADFGLLFGGPIFVLNGGNDQLPRAMARELSTQIKYGTEVTTIRETSQGVSVQAGRGGQSVRFEADRNRN